MKPITTEALITDNRKLNLLHIDLPDDCPLGHILVTMTIKKETVFGRLKRKAEEAPLAFMQMMQPGGRYDPETECYYAATPQGGEGTDCETSLKPGKKTVPWQKSCPKNEVAKRRWHSTAQL